jgi:hypothetical protein
MAINPNERCMETIYRGPWDHSSRCSRKGKVERDGKRYCGQHDPVAVKEKDDESVHVYVEQFTAYLLEAN